MEGCGAMQVRYWRAVVGHGQMSPEATARDVAMRTTEARRLPVREHALSNSDALAPTDAGYLPGRLVVSRPRGRVRHARSACPQAAFTQASGPAGPHGSRNREPDGLV